MSYGHRQFTQGDRRFRLEVTDAQETAKPLLRDGKMESERTVTVHGRLLEIGRPMRVIADGLQASGPDTGSAIEALEIGARDRASGAP